MADTETPHYEFILPEVGGSSDTWGTKLNQNFTELDGHLAALDAAAVKRTANLGDLDDAVAARAALGLGEAATRAVGTTAGTVAAGNDPRFAGALQKLSNLSDLDSRATARENLDLKGAALLDVGVIAGTVAAGNDARIVGAAQRSANLQDLSDVSLARTHLGLGALAQLSTVGDAQWSGGALSIAKGGTGAATAIAARAALGLGNVENKSSSAIREELTRANVETALAGKAPARVAFGLSANAGLISWGPTVPASLELGEIFLRIA